MALNRSEKHITKRKIYLLSLLVKASYYKLRRNEEAMMTTIADGFLRLGGVYIKFLQGVLLQLPTMKLWKSSKRFDVYEDVPTDDIDINKFLRSNLKPHQYTQIASVEEIPFASGSFGQVYSGFLRTSEDIIIKILRPNTKKLLKKDLRLIRFVTGFIASAFTNWSVDLKTLTKDFARSTLAETDYIAEAKFGTELYDFYLNNSTIVIPKTYMELSNKSIIVQEQINGLSVARLLKEHSSQKDQYAEVVRQKTGSDLKTQLLGLGFELNKAILSGGPIHGDPHPGNIRLLPYNQVALLDFGIHASPLKSPSAYYEMFKGFWKAEYESKPDPGAMFLSYIRFFSAKLYDSMRVVSKYASKKYSRPVELDNFIIELGNKTFSSSVSETQLQAGLDRIRSGETAQDISVNNVINKNNRFQFKARTQDSSILRAMITFTSLVTELGFRSVMAEVYNETINYVETYLPEINKKDEPTMSLTEAMETIYIWLEKIARQDTELYNLIQGYLKGL